MGEMTKFFIIINVSHKIHMKLDLNKSHQNNFVTPISQTLIILMLPIVGKDMDQRQLLYFVGVYFT